MELRKNTMHLMILLLVMENRIECLIHRYMLMINWWLIINLMV